MRLGLGATKTGRRVLKGEVELWVVGVREHRLVVLRSAAVHTVNCYALELILHLAIVLSCGDDVV